MILLALTAFGQSDEALAAYKRKEHLTARRLAENALADDPEDFVAHYVVGVVYRDEEGNLPRAFHHLDLADSYYQEQKESLDSEAWRTHWSVLKEKARVAKSMERADLYFDLVEEFNSLYDPDIKAETGWVLMKEGRREEARLVGEEAKRAEDKWQQSLGHNVLCALQSNQRQRRQAWEICKESLEHGREHWGADVVDAFNMSLSELNVLDFAAAEAMLQESIGAGSGTTTNPWGQLSSVLLLQGRGAEAVDAIQNMQAWRHRQEPTARAQSRATADAFLALVLLVAGEDEKGMAVIDRALSHPDRRANTSASHEGTKAKDTLIRVAMRKMAIERQRERAAMEGWIGRAGHWLSSWQPDPVDWEDHAVLVGILADEALLTISLAPYEDDGVVPAPWIAGELVPILGPGVVQGVVDRGREIDDFPGLQAYYDALEAEVAWHRGQSRTLELARRALAGLPKEEVLLRARMAALGADHAYRWGDPGAMSLYEQALQLDPSTLRRQQLALPAVVSASGGAIEERVADMLERSPRLTYDRSGFTVQVAGGRACLSSPLGNRIGCYSGEGKGTDEEKARSIVEAFHRDAFSLPLGLSTLDMDSLDGTTRLDEKAKRDALDSVLQGL